MKTISDDNAGVETVGAAVITEADTAQNAGSKVIPNEDIYNEDAESQTDYTANTAGSRLKPKNRDITDQVINPESINKLAQTNPQSLETNIGRTGEGIASKPGDIKAVAENPADEILRLRQMFARFNDLSQEAQNYYTRDEVAENDGRDGRPLFIIVENTVYNIKDFLPYHPGGKTVLLEYAGQDVTKEMRESPMPEIVSTTFLKLFKVGWVEEEDYPDYDDDY